jgi:hypothetical protein
MSTPQSEPVTSEHESISTKAAPGWLMPVVIGALVVGLAGLGVGIYAVVKIPAMTSGPTGAAGATGKQGVQGVQGPAGPQGAAGPAGTVAATSIVAASILSSAPDAPVGTALVAKTGCPTGKVLLSGGAQVSASSPADDHNVVLSSSFPLSDTMWQTVAHVTGPLAAGVSMNMKPYVVCGAP